MEHSDSTEECYLLTEWASANMESTDEWVEKLRTGVPDSTGNKAAVCEYTLQNLQMSRKAVLNSLEIDLWQEIEREVPFDATGPQVLTAVLEVKLQVTSSIVRSLVDELWKQKLTKTPAEDVLVFCSKIQPMIEQIEGSGIGPKDLSSIVAGCFQGAKNELFHLDVLDLVCKADKPNSKVTWKEIFHDLKMSYRRILGKNDWEPAWTNSKTTETEVSAMKAEIKKLTAAVLTQKENGSSSGGGNSGGGGGHVKEADAICHGCKQKGHFKHNCPNKNQGGNNNGSGGNNQDTNGGKGGSASAWKTVAPADGASEKQSRNGKEYFWCGKCKCWNLTHVTGQHKPKAELSQQSGGGNGGQSGTGGANVAVPETSGLRFNGGFFMAAGSAPIGNTDAEGTAVSLSHGDVSLEVDEWGDPIVPALLPCTDDDSVSDDDSDFGDDVQTTAWIRYTVEDNLGEEDVDQKEEPQLDGSTMAQPSLSLDFGHAGCPLSGEH